MKGARKLKLIITEKPSVGQSIAKVLGVSQRYDGYLEGNGYLVSWCVGHLVELAEPEAYDARYAKWKKDDLPILPERWQYRVSAATKKQFGILKALMKRADVTSLVNCCDAGREGELIFRLVYRQCGYKKPVERLWISSMEDSAIREGFSRLRSSSEYDALYEAALCRERADWIVGINATRLFSCLYGQTLNMGRVMTPTLAMVVTREANIAAFVPEPFYVVNLNFVEYNAVSQRFKNREAAERLQTACEKELRATVKQIDHKEKSEKPPALYDLTSLQRDANRLLGFTAQQTLDYVQSLYEKKLVTYPRTDSHYLTDDMAGMLSELTAMVQKKCGIAAETSAPVNSAQVVNSKKVSDHHAIIPTKTLAEADLSELPSGEAAVLTLIARRLVCAVGEPYRYLETCVEMDCAGHVFKAKGKSVIALGWKAFAGEQKEEPIAELPIIKEGGDLPLASVELKEGKTAPPKHFTEDLLLSAMESAGADEIPDDAERKGIGTPATRAGIIEKLVQKGFVERKGDKKAKILVPTSKGKALVAVVPEQIQSPAMTAQWEQKLLSMEHGDYAPENFMGEIGDMVTDLVHDSARVDGADTLFPPKGNVIGRCPACGADVVDRAKGYFCTNPACRFALWKDNRYFDSIGKQLTGAIAEKLLTDGKVRLKGCKSAKSGKSFDATLVLNTDEDGKAKYALEFERSGGKR